MKKILPYVLIPVVGVVTFYMVTQHRVEQRLENEPLIGVDADANGVRDDVDSIIRQVAPTSEKVRAALSQTAVALQNNLLDAADAEKSKSNYLTFIRAVDCVYSFDKRQKMAAKVIGAMKKQVVNNKTRQEAYIQFTQHLADVKVEPTPWQERRKGCNFDPESMAN